MGGFTLDRARVQKYPLTTAGGGNVDYDGHALLLNRLCLLSWT